MTAHTSIPAVVHQQGPRILQTLSNKRWRHGWFPPYFLPPKLSSELLLVAAGKWWKQQVLLMSSSAP